MISPIDIPQKYPCLCDTQNVHYKTLSAKKCQPSTCPAMRKGRETVVYPHNSIPYSTENEFLSYTLKWTVCLSTHPSIYVSI